MLSGSSVAPDKYTEDHPFFLSDEIIKALQELKISCPKIDVDTLDFCIDLLKQENPKPTSIIHIFLDIQDIVVKDLKDYKEVIEVQNFLKTLSSAISDCMAFSAHQVRPRKNP